MAVRKSKSRSILVFADGTTAEVTGETGKYYICGETRYRKANPRIVNVEKRQRKEGKEDAS